MFCNIPRLNSDELPLDVPFHLLVVSKFSTKLAKHTEANGHSIIAWQFPKAPRLSGRLPQFDFSRHVTLAIPCVNGRQICHPFYACVL
jgi:hypothetical protein